MKRFRNLFLAVMLGVDSGVALAQTAAQDRINQALQILGIAAQPESVQAIPAPAPPQITIPAPAPPQITQPDPVTATPPANPAATPKPSLSPELEEQARQILRLTKTTPNKTPPKAKPATTTPATTTPATTTPATTTPAILRPEDQRRAAEDARARARGSARPPLFIIEPPANSGPTPEEQARAEARRQEEISKIEAEILKAAEQKPASPAAVVPSTVPPPAPAPFAAIPLTTPLPANPPVESAPAASLPPPPATIAPAGTAEEAEQRAREILERKLAEVYGVSRASTAPVAPAPVTATPVVAPPVALTPLPAPTPAAPTEEVRLAEEEAKARARRQGEVEAATRAAQLRDDRERTASTKLKEGRASKAASSSALKSKEQRLAELLEAYQQDRITPGQYHQERAKVLAEP